MAGARTEIGWTEKPKNDPGVVELIRHLEASNGIPSLEILKVGDVDKIVRRFRRDGFVVVGDVLNREQISTLASGCHAVIDEVLRADTLAQMVLKQFCLTVHPRSIERALAKRRKKGR